jgi:fructose-bisphosphate aldolase, class I
MNVGGQTGGLSPCSLVFSFAHAIQQPWRGEQANVVAAQHALLHRARCNHVALLGEYQDSVEDKSAYRLAS